MKKILATLTLSLFVFGNSYANNNIYEFNKWLFENGSVVINSGPGTLFQDQYGATDPVGAGTSLLYWSDAYGLKGATPRILYNPYANNTQPSISGVSISGISFTQS